MSLILSGTNGLSDVDGSAATPAIRGTDTNTGLFFPAADTVGIATGGTERLRLDSSGNLGLGVTPSAWGSTFDSFELGTIGNFITGYVGAARLEIGANAYYNGTSWTYANTAAATRFTQISGEYRWYNAASGTAGNAITFTQAMTLDGSGRLGVGTSSPVALLNVVSGTNTTLSVPSGVVAQFKGSVVINSLSTASSGNIDNLIFQKSHTSGINISNYDLATITSYTSNGYAGGLDFYTNKNVGGGSYTSTFAMRIDDSQNLLVGTTGVTGSKLVVKSDSSGTALLLRGSSDQRLLQVVDGTTSGSPSATSAIAYLERFSSNSRSLNASGTLNASGADYAEYMTKAGDFTVAKGDVVGINEDGKLTNVFADAVSFVVKSTDPSYVGGDVWGTEEAIGMTRPTQPEENAADEEKAQYETDKAAFDAALEAARQMVDRVAFAGQVPVNVTGATAGQYIIPVNDNGAIKGEAVSNPTFEQYQQAVGKVIAIEQDGRARIIVKVA